MSLSSKLLPGECGRIGVVGGSSLYTGAPYFAAITSLKVVSAEVKGILQGGQRRPALLRRKDEGKSMMVPIFGVSFAGTRLRMKNGED
uniref:ATP-dependent NAD(P)H-hydrate dehydratase n=1 Tax=Parascaris equorum TaxID=6256 RepID=A0A914RGK2_PAREQ